MKNKQVSILACLLTISSILFAQTAHKPIVIAYVAGGDAPIQANSIAANKVTHINYAFAIIKDGKAYMPEAERDSINLQTLTALKKQNTDLKIVLSIGGWGGSGKFSDAVLTDESREVFARSAVDILAKFRLDGIDIDWEYPALPGYEGNIYRPEDKENYTLMFAAIRHQLDSLQTVTKQKYLLTTAVGAFQRFIDHTEMDKAQRYLDYVNIMTYDAQSRQVAIHHTNLYPTDPEKPQRSADTAIKAFAKAGVPMEKMVIGLAFYSRFYRLKEGAEKGLGDAVEKQIDGKNYTLLKDSIIGKQGYIRYWDANAQAPYLFNKQERIFVTYDDEQSVKAKCDYAKREGLAGIMFWEYSCDPKEYLLNAINESLNRHF